MDEPDTCASWHEELIVEVIQLLEGPAYGNEVVRQRERLAQLLAQHDLYDVRGDGRDDLIAPPRRRTRAPRAGWIGDETAAAPKDARDEATRRSDAQLAGAWWRCPTHGAQPDSIVLAGAAYCVGAGCGERVLLVGASRTDTRRRGRVHFWVRPRA